MIFDNQLPPVPRKSRHAAPFISFEGGEGAGKTTQAKLLLQRLKKEGHQTQLVREPGSTPLGEKIRKIIKSPNNKNVPAADALLFMAARAQMMNDLVEPKLKQGITIIGDRFADSTIAYQGFGGKLLLDRLKHANELATDGVVPDLTILLTINPNTGLARRRNADITNGDTGRRFEELPISFHHRVMRGYKKMAEDEPNRWIEIDASQPIQQVSDQIWQHVSPFFL